MISEKEILDSISEVREHLIELNKQPKDTSNDGVFILETNEGSCIQVVHNSIYMLLSYEAYDKLSEYYKGDLNVHFDRRNRSY